MNTFHICNFNTIWCWYSNEKPWKIFYQDLEKECPSGSPDHCVCTLDYVSRGLSAPYIWYPAIKVDCSYRDMKTLPKKLPHNTTTLLVQGNQVKKSTNFKMYSYVKYIVIRMTI